MSGGGSHECLGLNGLRRGRTHDSTLEIPCNDVTLPFSKAIDYTKGFLDLCRLKAAFTCQLSGSCKAQWLPLGVLEMSDLPAS
jgi:hypothetical protein